MMRSIAKWITESRVKIISSQIFNYIVSYNLYDDSRRDDDLYGNIEGRRNCAKFGHRINFDFE